MQTCESSLHDLPEQNSLSFWLFTVQGQEITPPFYWAINNYSIPCRSSQMSHFLFFPCFPPFLDLDWDFIRFFFFLSDSFLFFCRSNLFFSLNTLLCCTCLVACLFIIFLTSFLVFNSIPGNSSFCSSFFSSLCSLFSFSYCTCNKWHLQRHFLTTTPHAVPSLYMRYVDLNSTIGYCNVPHLSVFMFGTNSNIIWCW